MVADLQKVVAVVQALCKYRFMLRLPRLSKEEKRLYRRLLEINQGCWEDFLGIQGKNPSEMRNGWLRLDERI
jgi:hypothetical protein